MPQLCRVFFPETPAKVCTQASHQGLPAQRDRSMDQATAEGAASKQTVLIVPQQSMIDDRPVVSVNDLLVTSTRTEKRGADCRVVGVGCRCSGNVC
ncbi:hypothetical protein ACOMHN_058708 [Nucella lapillus]